MVYVVMVGEGGVSVCLCSLRKLAYEGRVLFC